MIDQIAVVGAGLMGHGIALTFARSGRRVTVQDPNEAARADLADRIRVSAEAIGCDAAETDALLSRIAVTDAIPAAVADADLVFEAAPEKPALKQALFAEIEAAAKPDCLFASNTSVIPISTIMGGLTRRGRALGTHWWNPPHMIPLVEVIRTEWSDDSAIDAVFDLLVEVGKRPVRVEKDVPGFIGNRLQLALWREAVSLVEKGICDADAVDTVVKESFGRRLAVIGPLENADLVGTDLLLDIARVIFSDLESRPDPSPYLEQLVETGRLGMKSGEGFHHWSKEEAAALHRRLATHLKRLETILEA
ncbi:3-hydroxyacyl-CoA dehydrogenase family protein [Amorphus sp. 3PC139-8]|uniref:3-hydroxyacyl-CoA dehydrogenase family protein n=1 Tax=Amorphus sp. 3PC139-8 TaxID=2735676 RepID=UPI00345D7578